MTTKLPQPISNYFTAANAHDVAAMSATFADEAIVRDEGREHHGRLAIRAWMKETIEKYDYQVEPLEASRAGEKVAVLASLCGTFPGSPTTIQYDFTLRAHEVLRLEIG